MPYINIPNRQTMTNYYTKEIVRQKNNLYQPLKHQQGIWSRSGINKYCPLYQGNDSNQDALFHSEKSHNTTKISSPDSSVSDNQHRVNQISNIVHIKLNH